MGLQCGDELISFCTLKELRVRVRKLDDNVIVMFEYLCNIFIPECLTTLILVKPVEAIIAETDDPLLI